LARVCPTHGQDTTRDSFFVALWNVGACDDEIAKNQVRVRAELARVGLLSLVDTLVNPYWTNNVNEAIDGVFILGKVCGGREDVGEFL
jgi:hypothetical protein